MRIGSHSRDEILADWAANIGHSESAKKAFAVVQAQRHHVSPRTIYRVLERVGKRARTSAGPTKPIGPDAMNTIIALHAQNDLGTRIIRNVLHANGSEALPSTSTIRRQLRQATGLTREKIRLMTQSKIRTHSLDCVRMKAAHANRIWQLDFSVSQQYYIDAAGAFECYDPLTQSKNKDGRDVVKLWLYACLDDHSSAGFAWFYPALSSRNAVDFLIKAMSRKGPWMLADEPGAPDWLRSGGCIARDPGEPDLDWFNDRRFPLCGVPQAILTDNDVILKSDNTLFKQAIERRLGVEVVHHLPGHSWVKGKVERSFFTSEGYQHLRRNQNFKSLYEANAALMDWLLAINVDRSGFSRWVSGLVGPVRLLDREELVRRMYLKQISAVVDNQVSISHDGRRIYLPREERFRMRVGDRIQVYLSDHWQEGDEVAVIGPDGREEWVTPIEPIVVKTGDEYRSLPKIAAQAMLDEARKMDLSGLKTSDIFHRLPQYQQEYEAPLGESYRPETLQPVRGALRVFFYAVRRFQEEGLFSRPVKEQERSWLKSALYANREEVCDADLEDFLRSVKTGKWNVGDKVAVFA